MTGRNPESKYEEKDRDWWYDQYVVKDKPMRQIARELSIGHSTVKHFLNKHKIRIKPNGYHPKNRLVHHIDLDEDNNNEDNLFYCSQSEHASLHRNLEELAVNLIRNRIKNGEIIFDKTKKAYVINR